MKKALLFVPILLVLFMFSCNDDTVSDDVVVAKEVSILKEGKVHHISNAKTLEGYITEVFGKDINIKEAFIGDIKAVSTTFLGVRGVLSKDDGGEVTFTIPLKKASTAQAKRIVGIKDDVYTIDCEMSCSKSGSCGGCSQTIIVPCRSQSCDCNVSSGDGGCDATINLPYTEG